jgi:hypothetical protein
VNDQHLTAKEVTALIERITMRLTGCLFLKMTTAHHTLVVQATNDLQVISNLLCRAMPLHRVDWANRYD